MKIAQDFFLKNRLIVMRLARDFLVTAIDAQINTIDYYVDVFHVSRGTVQAAMVYLVEQGCINTQFRGHLGTYLVKKDDDKLWEFSGFGTLTGAMSLPLNPLVAGLATGICDCMRESGISFNCMFVQGSRTRMRGLDNDRYDFIIASKLTEKVLLEEYPSIERVLDLPGCAYSGKYVLLLSDPAKTQIEDGMTIAVDPSSMDQYYLTNCVSKDKKNLRFKELSFIHTRVSILQGEADAAISRLDALGDEYRPHIKDLVIPGISDAEFDAYTSSVVLALKENYGIDKILRHGLKANLIAHSQMQVISGERAPSYY